MRPDGGVIINHSATIVSIQGEMSQHADPGVVLVVAGADTMKTAIVTQSLGVFSMTCRVALCISAPAPRVWSLLTDANDFPRWNSTVTRVEGQIREGQRLRLRVPGKDRTFTPRVSGVVPNERMTWIGGFSPVFKGVRTFELKPCNNDSSTQFVMEERFFGLMLPFVKSSMPDLRPVFERYANDLKDEAERTQPPPTKCLNGIQRPLIVIREVRLRRSTSSPRARSEVFVI